MIDIEKIREFGLSLPMVTEDMAFGPENLLLRVCGKIFVCIDIENGDLITLKCDPDKAMLLRDRYDDVEPAWHWNKRYWNQLRVHGSLSDDFALEAVKHSYSEVVKKLPGKIKREHPELTEITAQLI